MLIDERNRQTTGHRRCDEEREPPGLLRAIGGCAHGAESEETADHGGERDQVGPREHRHRRGQAGRDGAGRGPADSRCEREGPPACCGDVAGWRHQFDQEARTRGEQDRRERTGQPAVDKCPEHARQPHSQSAEQWHHVEDGVPVRQPLEDRHQDRHAHRIGRYDEAADRGRPIARRRERPVGERPRQRSHELLFDPQRAVRDQIRLTDVSERIARAGDE